MKSFYSFASLAVTALCSEDLGPWSYSKEDTETLINRTGLAVWKIKT